MIIQLQIIHNFSNQSEIELLIKEVMGIINEEIIKKHPPLGENKVEPPISFYIKYFKKGDGCNLTGVCLDYSEYVDDYYEDYNSTIIMGFGWGAGSAIDELNSYIDKFIDSLKQNNNVFEILKFEDYNQKFAYWQLFQEIYEIEMQLREIISFLLFGEAKNNNIIDVIREKLVLRHSIDREVLNRNCENEVFSLDFTHYKKILETYPELFAKEIIEDIDTVRDFRNSLMHNKGFTYISPENFWNTQERLVKFINDFWNNEYE